MNRDLTRVLTRGLLVGAGGWVATRAFAALRPTAFPYFLRAIIQVPRPLLTARGLVAILGPTPGERVLELGPGTGYYTAAVAERLVPAGALDVLDVRQRFLDHTMAKIQRRGIANVVPTLGDGASLPYPDAEFDAAFLVTVLGEIPDPDAALREMRRVLKPEGRLVVGEIIIDPDFTTTRWLTRHASAAGLVLERRAGNPLAYFARFSRPA